MSRTSQDNLSLPTRLRLALVALCALVFASLLSGCIDMTTRVYADGRIKREFVIRVTEGRESGARVYLKETFPRTAGWALKEVQRGSEVWFIATSRPVDPEEDPWGGRASLTVASESQLYTSLVYTETLTDKLLFRSDEERAGFDHLSITYSIEMPGQIDEESEPPSLRPLERYLPTVSQAPGDDEGAEATVAPQPSFQIKQRIDGSRVTWDLPLAALAPHGIQVTLKATRLNRAKASLWSIVGVVALILLYFIVVRLLVWRRVRAERAAELRELEEEEAWDEDDGDEDTGGAEPGDAPKRAWWPFGRGSTEPEGESADDEDAAEGEAAELDGTDGEPDAKDDP